MSVYNPTGSGAVHTDKVISGGRQKVAMPPQLAKAIAAKKAGAKKAAPAKKAAAKKAAAKKMPMKAMSDAACPPGSMSGGAGTSKGIGAAKATKKATPRAKAMAEVGIKRSTAKRADTTSQVKKSAARSLPSQNRIQGYPDLGKSGISAPRGGKRTSGSDVN
jgi:hypothetical protein